MKQGIPTFIGLSFLNCYILAANAVEFSHDVLPLLKAHCAKCHTNGTYKAGFSMDTREAILESEHVQVGDSAASELIALLQAEDPDERMPQKADALSAEEIQALKTWIDEGLAWEEGFTFKESSWDAPLAPRRPEIPPVGTLGAHPIDRFVDAYFTKHEMQAPFRITDRAFIRRASLDLLGLLPNPDAIDAFVEDTSVNKRDELIPQMLGRSVDYADHWLTFWNDLLRNDYKGTGFIDGGRKQITGWLYGSLIENKPYDVFTRELISPDDASQGFIKGIQWRGNVNASQRTEVQFAQNVSQVFLGENMKCASCHDSFINDWKLKDAYGLAAVIAEEPLEIHRCDKPTGEFAATKFPFPSLGSIDAGAPKEARLQQTARLMTSPENGRFSRTIVNRLWQRLLGRGLVEPVDMMSNQPWSEDILDYLAVHLMDNGYDLKKTLALIVSSKIYQSAPMDRHTGPPEDFVFKGPVAKRMTAEQFIDAVWQLTGQAPENAEADGAKDRQRTFVRASIVNSTSMMNTLGRPNREQVVTVRPEDLSTLQALELNNGKEFSELLGRGADHLIKSLPDSGADTFIHYVFRHGLSRQPNEEEMAMTRPLFGETISKESVADLLWSVFLLPEFQIIH
ncbi:MAG: cytochrome c553 [Verrucomicrobiales bacterium]|jgi:cytochrome c553